MKALLARASRILRKSPSYIARRVLDEARNELDRFVVPYRVRSFDDARLLALTGDTGVDALWGRLASQPWCFDTAPRDPARFDELFPGARAGLLRRAASAARHEVDILGSGPVALGPDIQWDRDFRTGDVWPPGFFRSIPVVDRSRPSDVKMPWELSRKQWLLPLGEAFLLDGDECHAVAARDILTDWIERNPVAGTVNWAIAMEPAMRAFVWCWLFRVFAGTCAWSEPRFRSAFLRSLYQHGAFVQRYIERADVNGNHYTADLAALVLLGAFFGRGEGPRGWLDEGWSELEREIPLQVLPDGVDFEASTAYHRLVGELFLLAAAAAGPAGRAPSAVFVERLRRMAQFTVAYMRPDGTCPLWGDADDARVLPLGVAPVTNHWHFVACAAHFLGDADLAGAAVQGRDEVYWLFGEAAASALPSASPPRGSAAFRDGGAYVIRAADSHVFVDCGPVGLAGRGGHGHNDILAFDAVLGGVGLVTDPGCYVYTASFDERNTFRSTRVHNTPQVDGEEVNRFLSPDFLWFLHDDAHAADVCFEAHSEGGGVFEGSHTGFDRLATPVRPKRRIELSPDGTRLRVCDSFEGRGSHSVRVPFQLATGTQVESADERRLSIHRLGRSFALEWHGQGNWAMAVVAGRVAPSYGVVCDAPVLVWRAQGAASALSLTISIEIAQRMGE